ncbi:MAG TPA: GPP34 family phosphoprotein [Acetobacteraceae bacterium]|jgi:golgi phosphoprotein 3|nr:GPP34 family phosphoprotein [Acetobacteraceae bacterium]
MLTFAEELLLLVHDEKRGSFHDMQDMLFDAALAGAVLMDLAIRNRIDTDLEKLVVLDRTPTGEKLLDHGLARLGRDPTIATTADALDLLRKEGAAIQEMALERLVERGILRRDAQRILWVFEARRYPLIDGKELREVKLRISELIFSDTIPDPADVVIISLANTCGLLDRVFSEDEVRRSRARIEQLAKLDLIGQATDAMLMELSTVLTSVLMRYG